MSIFGDQEKAKQQAMQVYTAIQRALDPFIDQMDANAPNKDEIIGLLLGVNAWMGQFRGLEGALLPVLENVGFTRDAYQSMIMLSNTLGAAFAAALQQELDVEEAGA